MHFQSIYYRPSFQGGDTVRALCQTGLGVVPVAPEHLTEDPQAVTCTACLRKLKKALQPA